MFKTVNAIALGTVATSIGLVHFDPTRSKDDEGGRYRSLVLPTADAEKAEKKGLVEIKGDATQADFDLQQSGADINAAERAAQRLMELPDVDERADGTGTGTAVVRNFAAGQGFDAPNRTLDPDAPPAPPADEDERDPTLALSVPKLSAKLEEISDAAEIDRLLAAEQAGQNRSGAVSAIEARKQALASA